MTPFEEAVEPRDAGRLGSAAVQTVLHRHARADAGRG